METFNSFPLCWYKCIVFRPRFCVLSCTHADPDRHSQDHIHSSNIYVIYIALYAILSSWEKVGLFCAWSHTENFLTLIFLIVCVCVLNVTTRLLEAVHFYCFQKSLFSKQCIPYLKIELLVAT